MHHTLECKYPHTIIHQDGGIACVHWAEDHLITSYYQTRMIPGEVSEEDTWEGKMYCKDWDYETEDSVVEGEVVEDALNWLCRPHPEEGYTCGVMFCGEAPESHAIQLEAWLKEHYKPN